MPQLYKESVQDIGEISVWKSNDEYIDKEREREKEYLIWKASWKAEVRKRKMDRIRNKLGVLCGVISVIGGLFVFRDHLMCRVELGRVTANEAKMLMISLIAVGIIEFVLIGLFYRRTSDSKEKKK